MLNNTFTVVGTAISNYERMENTKYERYVIRIEVERKNKSRVDVYPIQVMNWNKTIDTKAVVVGEVVIVNGYLDVWNDQVSLIAQDIYVVGVDENYTSNIENKIVPEDEDEDDESIDQELEQCGITDDELPF